MTRLAPLHLALILALVAVAVALALWYWYRHRNVEQELYDDLYAAYQEEDMQCSSDKDLRMAAKCTADTIISKYGQNKVRSWLSGGSVSEEGQNAMTLIGVGCLQKYCPSSTSSQ